MRISTQTVALASARHPWRVIAAWAVTAVLALVAVGALLGDALTTEGRPTNTRSRNGRWRLGRKRSRDAREPPRRSSSARSATRSTRRHSVPLVAGSPTSCADRRRRRDRHARRQSRSSRRTARSPRAALASRTPTTRTAVIAAVQRADASPAFEVNVTGEKTREHDFNQLSQDDLKSGELQFGLPAALIILLLVFGGVVAGLVPLLMAMSSIVVALGLTALVAQEFELSVFVVNMLTGMGLALGIDYALFVVSRYREERGRGREQLDAISATGVTASRAVLFSGTAFVIAMFGMLIVPSSIMRSLAVGAILVGAVSVAAALTLLPALLGLLGDRVDALRIPLIGRPVDRGGKSRRALLGRHRAVGATAAGVEPGSLRRRPACPGSADLRHADRHERRDDAARALRVQTGIRRACGRVSPGDDGADRDRRHRAGGTASGSQSARRPSQHARGRPSLRPRDDRAIRGRRDGGADGARSGRSVGRGCDRRRSRPALTRSSRQPSAAPMPKCSSAG